MHHSFILWRYIGIHVLWKYLMSPTIFKSWRKRFGKSYLHLLKKFENFLYFQYVFLGNENLVIPTFRPKTIGN